MAIGGRSDLVGTRTSASYYFSHLPSSWGWATWRRAWQHYDIELKIGLKIGVVYVQRSDAVVAIKLTE